MVTIGASNVVCIVNHIMLTCDDVTQSKADAKEWCMSVNKRS